MLTEAALNLDVVDNLERYHKTSDRFSHILNAGNPIFLNHYVPKVKFNTPQLNTPLAQFVYNKTKRSALFNKTDAGKILKAIESLLFDLERKGNKGPYEEYNINTTIGRIRLSTRQLAFMDTGERYGIPSGDIVAFYENLAEALTVFRTDKPKGTPYPFATSVHMREGLREESMMLVTTYGDQSHDTPPSYLRYVHSERSDKLMMRYGNTELYINSSRVREMKWIDFIAGLFTTLQDLDGRLDESSLNFIFKEDPILGKYNTYVSVMNQPGTKWLTINTDMAPTNNKVMFMINEDNYEHLKTFLGGVLYFLRDRSK